MNRERDERDRKQQPGAASGEPTREVPVCQTCGRTTSCVCKDGGQWEEQEPLAKEFDARAFLEKFWKARGGAFLSDQAERTQIELVTEAAAAGAASGAQPYCASDTEMDWITQLDDLYAVIAHDDPPFEQRSVIWRKFLARHAAAPAGHALSEERVISFLEKHELNGVICMCGWNSEISPVPIHDQWLEHIRPLLRASQAGSQPILDLQLFYDQLVDGQIIKESDGEPWALTKSEAEQICEALRDRLSIVWPKRSQAGSQ